MVLRKLFRHLNQHGCIILTCLIHLRLMIKVYVYHHFTNVSLSLYTHSSVFVIYMCQDLFNLCKNNPNIKSLQLRYCGSLTNNGMKNAFQYLNSLVCVEIGRSVEQLILINCTVLKECLDFENIKGINEEAIIKFKNLKK